MIIWLMAKGKTNCAKVRRSGEERFCFQRFNSYLNRSSPPFDLTQTRVRDFGKQTHAGVVRDRANLLATILRPLPHREKRIFFGGITVTMYLVFTTQLISGTGERVSPTANRSRCHQPHIFRLSSRWETEVPSFRSPERKSLVQANHS